MASVTQQGKETRSRPSAPGSGPLAAAQPISNTPSKAGIWSVLLLQDIVLGLAVYIVCVCSERP